MAQNDSIGVVLDEAELKKVKDAIGVLNATLLPKLKTLTAQDKKELPKLGDKSTAFVQKAFDYSEQHEGLQPAWLDVEAFAIDVTAVASLRKVVHDLQPLVDALDDSLALSGSEAYQAALTFYGKVKTAAKRNVGGAQESGRSVVQSVPWYRSAMGKQSSQSPHTKSPCSRRYEAKARGQVCFGPHSGARTRGRGSRTSPPGRVDATIDQGLPRNRPSQGREARRRAVAGSKR